MIKTGFSDWLSALTFFAEDANDIVLFCVNLSHVVKICHFWVNTSFAALGHSYSEDFWAF